ncbi:unnamed protein product [Sphacelaria rigidula]
MGLRCQAVERRTVPCSLPTFHGWPVSKFDIVLSSTAHLRYICCPVCCKWIPESSLYHTCQIKADDVAETAAARSDGKPADFAIGEEDIVEQPRQRACVVATDENLGNHMCNLCQQRMRLEYIDNDDEDWVFMDRVEHEGRIVHELCRDVVFG